jgi:uncharacterized protein YjbJ (UPF0337 family)
MNRDRLAGAWRILSREMKNRWDRLTDEDLDEIYGRYDQLIGRVQQRYGKARDEAESEVVRWISGLDIGAPPRDPSDHLSAGPVG